MCMDKIQLANGEYQSNSEGAQTEESSFDNMQYHGSSVDNSPTSYDEADIIEFGPIKVKPRKKPAPTLATGRRSKYEPLTPEEEQKRDLRRARNRAAAERVRISRLNVEQDLQGQIDALEDEEQKLYMNIQMLEDRKVKLQTRLGSHGNTCLPNAVSNTSNTHYNNTMTSSIFPPVEQVSDLNFDDIFSSLSTPVQNQPNHHLNYLPYDISTDDFDDILTNL